jgi:hypothetical protein
MYAYVCVDFATMLRRKLILFTQTQTYTQHIYSLIYLKHTNIHTKTHILET